MEIDRRGFLKLTGLSIFGQAAFETACAKGFALVDSFSRGPNFFVQTRIDARVKPDARIEGYLGRPADPKP